MAEWDPIGVAAFPEAADEYDTYVPGIARALSSGASADEPARRLLAIERDRAGPPGDPDRARHAAEALIGLARSAGIR